ncbi:DUF4097 family beta strand repeat-containing protein [Clostridium sp. JS66]|uniref:DUF4097 family beta strand repeat-containing protein n=1 Tax=Clostridium sp. JS66 TaxID=3064705 RepID=UPI00298DF98D|nr:DUF4097 family beta strand repeat-containing protein [Clostridium sp. JS66]WPC43238.1 DUF4097 family beta strand repeat-containing protein [Clostridium sp. JS66]
MFNINIKKLVIILISIIVLSFSAGGTILLATGSFENFNSLGVSSKAYIINDEKTQKIDGIKEIYIEGSSENISIISENRKDVKSHLYGDISASFKPELQSRVEGSKLIISVKRPSGSFNFSSREGLKLDINVPETYASDMSVKLSSGKITSSNPIKLNNFNLDLSSGSVDLKNLTASNLSLEATSGKIYGENIVCENSSLRLSSGSINLNGFKGNINHRCTSGKTEITYSEFNNNVNLNVSSGEIILNLPKSSQFALNAKADLGNIKCDFPVTIQGESKRNQLNGVVGNNKNQINISATSGSIKIKNH